MPRIGISRAEMNRRALDCAQLGQYDGAIAWALVCLSNMAEAVAGQLVVGGESLAPDRPDRPAGFVADEDLPVVVPVYAGDA